VAILASFDARNTPRSGAEILHDCGIARATGFALIRALVAGEWLRRVDHGLLQLGPRAAGLMFMPLEPGAALGEPRLGIVSAAGVPGRGRADASAAGSWRPDLAELVDTARYRLDRPVRLGFANASVSNAWRAALLSSMEYARRLNADRIAHFQAVSAEDDAERQIAQINGLVASGIDLLIISCPNVNSRALNDRLAALAGEGLPILALDRRPSDASALVSFVTASDSRIGRITAQWMVERLGPGKRVWMLSGVKDASPAIRRQTAALSVFSGAPEFTVEAIIYTDWTEAGGYAAVDRLLDQVGRAPDGVWCDSGLQGVGSIRRFREQGAVLPMHTGGDLNGMYKTALECRLPFVAVDYPAAMGARAVEVALEILAGRPVRRRVEVAAPVVLPRGAETPSVRADIWAETHVRWDLPDDAILSQGPSLRARVDRPRATRPRR
jgi:ABC-type sugar transport system substrate-binding protein